MELDQLSPSIDGIAWWELISACQYSRSSLGTNFSLVLGYSGELNLSPHCKDPYALYSSASFYCDYTSVCGYSTAV